MKTFIARVELRERYDGERRGVYISLDTQLFLLFLELISLCSCGGPVLGLFCGPRLSQTLVYQSLLIVASASGFVHEALCVAFLKSGNNLFASWIPLSDEKAE